MLHVEAHTPVGQLELDVDLSVEPGATLAIAGPSGAGKTSLLRVAAGLMHPRRGFVSCDGQVWLDTERGITLSPELRRCGYVFQEYALFPNLSALENVVFALRDLPRRSRRMRALELLERFGVAGVAGSHPRTLSGGERQRVALARALARRPRTLLLDEPLAALDARTRASAARELAEVLRSGDTPALLVTHDFGDAAQLAERVGVMDRGQVVQLGTATELAARPRSAFVADFTGAVVLNGVARRDATGLTTIDLDGGGVLSSTDAGSGPVAASVFPWEIEVEPRSAPHGGSARNRLDAEVTSVTVIGNRVRVGLRAGQHLVAEITEGSAERLGLRPGAPVTASWKAAATRVLPL